MTTHIQLFIIKSVLIPYYITTHLRDWRYIYRPRFRIMLIALVLLCSWNLRAQSHGGTPQIAAFTSHQYGASMQNWDIAQDDREVLYFANNDGMLTFDGANWKTYPLPNRTIVRSVEIDDHGMVYCGGQNEFGRFEPDPTGNWKYRSLMGSIPEEYLNFDDVWDIRIQQDDIAFRSAGRIYISNSGQWTVYDSFNFHFFDLMDGRVIGQAISGLLYALDGNAFHLIKGAEMLANTLILGSLPYHNGYLIATEHHGLFLYQDDEISPIECNLSAFLRDNAITKIDGFANGDLVIGTIFGGLILLDDTLGIKHHIHVDNGLLNNNVMSILVSMDQHIWVGSSRGINFIEANSPFTYIKPDGQLDGIGYTAAIMDDKIYYGTNNGLYYSALITGEKHIEDLNRYIAVPGSKGQVWGLNSIDGQLILSHQNGAFQLRDGIAVPFYQDNGVWLMQKDLTADNSYFLGTYNGIKRGNYENGRFVMSGQVSEMNESSRFIVQDGDGTIWMAHPYRGIYHLTEDSSGQWLSELYGIEQGLPSYLHNHVFFIADKVLFCPERGVYEFDAENKQFKPYSLLDDLLGNDVKIRRLFEDAQKNIWFVTDKEVGILTVEDIGLERKITKKVFPKLKKKMHTGWEFIYPYDERNVFLTSTDGFIHYDPSFNVPEDSSVIILMQEVRSTGRKDSIFFNGVYYDGKQVRTIQPEGERKAIPPFYNTIQFRFGTSAFNHQEDMLYRYRLDNFESEWSDWSTQRMKEYTRLGPGKYTFSVQATTRNQQIHGTTEYCFEILRPWYRSLVAWLAYTLLALFGLIILFYFNRRKIIRLEEEVEQTVSQSKNTIERLENERIAEQLEIKKRELITSTMHLIHKNETMEEIKGKLGEISNSCSDKKTTLEIRKMVQRVQRDADLDDHWKDLMYHFNEVNKDFFINLKARYDSLTTRDLKLCAYLRMNLSTKEIALLANVSPRGIDASRYRLRKKLEVNANINLTEFLMEF